MKTLPYYYNRQFNYQHFRDSSIPIRNIDAKNPLATSDFSHPQFPLQRPVGYIKKYLSKTIHQLYHKAKYFHKCIGALFYPSGHLSLIFICSSNHHALINLDVKICASFLLFLDIPLTLFLPRSVRS